MENRIVIDLEKFKGKSSRDLKTHIEQILSNIKCSVQIPGPNGKLEQRDFRLFESMHLKASYEDYCLTDIVNEN